MAPGDTVAAAPSSLSYMQISSATPASLPGFIDYEKARWHGTFQPKPLALYFSSSRAKRCQEQKQILSAFNSQKWADRVILAELEITRFPQIAQQYGVFRVPYWIFFDARGNALYQSGDILDVSNLEYFLGQLAK